MKLLGAVALPWMSLLDTQGCCKHRAAHSPPSAKAFLGQLSVDIGFQSTALPQRPVRHLRRPERLLSSARAEPKSLGWSRRDRSPHGKHHSCRAKTSPERSLQPGSSCPRFFSTASPTDPKISVLCMCHQCRDRIVRKHQEDLCPLQFQWDTSSHISASLGRPGRKSCCSPHSADSQMDQWCLCSP